MRKCTEVGFNLGEKNPDITCHSENLFLENCECITNSIFFGIPKKIELVIHFKIKTDRIGMLKNYNMLIK